VSCCTSASLAPHQFTEYSLKNNSCMSIHKKTQLILENRDNVLTIVKFSELYRHCMKSVDDQSLDCVVMEEGFLH